MTRHKRHSGNDDERRWVDDIIFSHIGFVHGTAGLLLYIRGGVSCTFIASLPLSTAVFYEPEAADVLFLTL